MTDEFLTIIGFYSSLVWDQAIPLFIISLAIPVALIFALLKRDAIGNYKSISKRYFGVISTSFLPNSLVAGLAYFFLSGRSLIDAILVPIFVVGISLVLSITVVISADYIDKHFLD